MVKDTTDNRTVVLLRMHLNAGLLQATFSNYILLIS